MPLTFTLETKPGTKGRAVFEQNNSNTIELLPGPSTPLRIKGLTASSTKDNIVLKALDGGGKVVASTMFSVVWVTISIRTRGVLSPNNGARLQLIECYGDDALGTIMTTGGRGVTAELARAMKARGIYSVSVSVDGLESTHDLMRAARGSHRAAFAALAHFRAAGVTVTANTNFNRTNARDLEAIYEELKAAGIVSWQVQLTAPLGRAADRPDMLLQPWDLLDLVPRIARLKARAFDDGILIMPGNNLGYFGPEEALLRSVRPDGNDHFRGCLAGRFVMGIEADGAVKGCPSLQTRAYVGGSLRERSLRDIWDESPALAFTRTRDASALWGFCASCPFADPCMGGCTFTAHAIMGRPGNNPYCHYRALDHQKRGLRERLVRVEAAAGEPFDNGRFAIELEPIDAPYFRPTAPRELVKLRRGPTVRSE
jgi:radical SAM protein with 4Fe4S-binding SPASM domain